MVADVVPDWVQSQHGIFVRWCNMHLEPAHVPIANLGRDFRSGVQLCYLVEAITGYKLGKFHTEPKHMEAYENVGLALDELRGRGVKLDLVGPEDFVEGNLKMILGFVWQLILQFAVADIQEDGLSARDGLLLWCKRRIEPYGLIVEDFRHGWSNGLALCALIDHYLPDLLDYDKLDKTDSRACVEQALAAAAEAGIPALLEANEILRGPDEKALVTYLAYWHHMFAGADHLESAGRRVEKFCSVWAVALRLRKEYEQRFEKLVEAMAEQRTRWLPKGDKSAPSACPRSAEQELRNYKATTKREWLREKLEIGQLFGQICIKLGTYGFAPYTPAPELSVAFLNMQWLNLLECEIEYATRLAALLREQREAARAEFATCANELAAELHQLTVHLSAMGGSTEEQLEEIVQQDARMPALRQQLELLKGFEQKCGALGIEASDHHTVYTHSDLEYELQLAEQALLNKLTFIENQRTAQSHSVSPALLEEFETVFRHFDRSHKNRLDFSEFRAALESLGESLEGDGDVQSTFDACAKNGAVSFQSFIGHMVSTSTNRPTREQVLKAFKEIAQNKPVVTREDLEAALLAPEVVDQLMAAAGPEGLDYEAYLRQTEEPKEQD